MKRILAAVLMLLLFPACSAAETLYVDVAYGSGLNVREWPDTESGIISTVKRGDAVTVIQTDDGWSRCERVADNKGGWVKTDYLSTDPPEMIPTGEYRIVADGRVDLRKKPNGKHVLWLDAGKTITVKDWAEVDSVLWAIVKGGAVNAKYLERVEE